MPEMKRLHVLLDSGTITQLRRLARAKRWSQSGVVRVAVNALYQREIAPLSVAMARIGRPKLRRKKK